MRLKRIGLAVAEVRAFARYAAIAALIAAGLIAPAVAAVDTATLTTANGNWNVAGNWTSSPAGNFPNNGTPTVSDTWVANVGLSVTVNTPITIDTLNWSVGTLTLSGSNTLSLVGSTSTWSTSSFKDIDGLAASFTNSGTIALTGSNLRSFSAGSGLTNLSSGTFDIQTATGSLVNNNIGTFQNNSSATFKKSVGGGTSAVNWTFNNDGGVQVLAGTLQFAHGGNYGGTTAISSNATADFAGTTTFMLQNGASASGAGEFLVSAAPVDLANNATYTSTARVHQTGGSLAGNGNASSTLNLNGNYDWEGGTLGGNGVVTILAGTTNTWSNTTFKDINGAAANMQNSGTINYTGSNLRSFSGGSGLTNLTGGVFDIQTATGSLVNSNIGTFQNNSSATFKKSVGGGTSVVNWTFNNDGAVQVLAGTLQFAHGGNYGGTTAISSNAVADFAGSTTFALQNGGSASGAGEFLVSLAPVDLANGATYTSTARVHQTGGSLAGNGNASSTLNLNGNFDWEGGTLGGSGGVSIGSGTTNTWSNTTFKEINSAAANMQNSGTINYTGSNLRSFSGGSGLTNLSGGVFDIQTATGSLVNNNVGTFQNNSSATFKKSVGGGTSAVNWTFNNDGAVQVLAGTLQFAHGGNYGGTMAISSGAVAEFAGSTTFVLQNGGSASGAGEFLVSLAPVDLANNATYTSTARVHQTGGSLAGNGNISSTLNLNGNFNWEGGTLGGNGGVSIGSGTTNTWSNSSFKDINGTAANMQNGGTINYTGSNLRSFSGGSGLTNLSGGVFDIQSATGSLVNNNIGTFQNNSGATFRKSVGGGTSAVNWAFSNSGLIDVQAGTLQFNNSFTQSGGKLTTSTSASVTFSSPADILAGIIAGSGTINTQIFPAQWDPKLGIHVT